MAIESQSQVPTPGVYRGTVARVHATFGFILGDDGHERFFIPSGLQHTTLPFERVASGQRVQLTHIDHPKGPRAIEIRVL